MRGLKLLSVHCFYYLQTIIVSQYRCSVGGIQKIRETYKPRGEFKQNSNIAIGPLPTLQTSPGLLALFEKIYYGDLIFPVISNNGEDVQYRCFN